MRIKYLVPPALLFCLVAIVAIAQPPAPPNRGGPSDRQSGNADPAKLVQSAIDKMMAFDVNKTGKLTKKDITDQRLIPLFERADANHDGEVTKEELTALFTKEAAALNARGSGPGGPGGPGGRGPGGPGGPGSRGPGGPNDRGGPAPGGPGGPPPRDGGPPAEPSKPK